MAKSEYLKVVIMKKIKVKFEDHKKEKNKQINKRKNKRKTKKKLNIKDKINK